MLICRLWLVYNRVTPLVTRDVIAEVYDDAYRVSSRLMEDQWYVCVVDRDRSVVALSK